LNHHEHQGRQKGRRVCLAGGGGAFILLLFSRSHDNDHAVTSGPTRFEHAFSGSGAFPVDGEAAGGFADPGNAAGLRADHTTGICGDVGEPVEFAVQPGAIGGADDRGGSVCAAVEGCDGHYLSDCADSAFWADRAVCEVSAEGTGGGDGGGLGVDAGEHDFVFLDAQRDCAVPGAGIFGAAGGIEGVSGEGGASVYCAHADGGVEGGGERGGGVGDACGGTDRAASGDVQRVAGFSGCGEADPAAASGSPADGPGVADGDAELFDVCAGDGAPGDFGIEV